MPTLQSHTHCQAAQASRTSQSLSKSVSFPTHTDDRKKARLHNITYTQAGASCFVGQESSKFKVQFFVGSSVVKIPACV
jgi:hypothetical protein